MFLYRSRVEKLLGRRACGFVFHGRGAASRASVFDAAALSRCREFVSNGGAADGCCEKRCECKGRVRRGIQSDGERVGKKPCRQETSAEQKGTRNRGDVHWRNDRCADHGGSEGGEPLAKRVHEHGYGARWLDPGSQEELRLICFPNPILDVHSRRISVPKPLKQSYPGMRSICGGHIERRKNEKRADIAWGPVRICVRSRGAKIAGEREDRGVRVDVYAESGEGNVWRRRANSGEA